MQSIVALWRNTKAMPQVLRVFCQGAMVAPPILAALLVLPLSDWTVNGREVPYSELWGSGAGVTFLAFTGMATVGAWGMAARRNWARWVWVATPVIPLVVASIYPSTWFTEQAVGEFSTWLSAIGAGAVLLACLFLPSSVNAYISAGERADA